jgi:hypothetical protein
MGRRRYPYVMRGRPRPRERSTVDDPPDHRIPQLPTYAPSPAQVIRRLTRQNALDPRLMPTDRHMQRWAVGQGNGFPDPERALFLESRLTPLPLEVDVITDQIVLSSPEHWQRFLVRWYRSDCSAEQLASELGIGRDKLFIERRIVLAYLLGRLTASGICIPTFEATT